MNPEDLTDLLKATIFDLQNYKFFTCARCTANTVWRLKAGKSYPDIFL